MLLSWKMELLILFFHASAGECESQVLRHPETSLCPRNQRSNSQWPQSSLLFEASQKAERQSQFSRGKRKMSPFTRNSSRENGSHELREKPGSWEKSPEKCAQGRNNPRPKSRKSEQRFSSSAGEKKQKKGFSRYACFVFPLPAY